MTDADEVDNEEGQMEAMESDVGSAISDESFWKMFWHQIRLVWYLLRDPEVPIYVKVVPLIALIYALSPTDIIPDVFPVIGQLDDITALLVGGKVFIELSPPHVVKRHLEAIRSRSTILSDELEVEQASDVLEDAIVIEGDYEAIEESDSDQA